MFRMRDVIEMVMVTLVTAMAMVAVYLGAKLESDKMEAAKLEAERLEEAQKTMNPAIQLFQRVWTRFVLS